MTGDLESCVACGKALDNEAYLVEGVLGQPHHVCPESEERARRGLSTRAENDNEASVTAPPYYGTRLFYGFGGFNWSLGYDD